VLACGRVHQSRHALNIHTIEMRLRGTADSTRAMHHRLCLIYEATQAVKIPKIAHYQVGGNSGQTTP
jgi:hypothetical protein